MSLSESDGAARIASASTAGRGRVGQFKNKRGLRERDCCMCIYIYISKVLYKTR